MTDAAAIAEVAQVARGMRRMSTAEVLDPNERVHTTQRYAGRLERAVAALAIALLRDAQHSAPQPSSSYRRRKIEIAFKDGRRITAAARGQAVRD